MSNPKISAAAVLVGLGLTILTRGPLCGQEPEEEPPAAVRDTAAPPGAPAPESRPRRQGCPLVLEPESSTTLHRIQRGSAYVYYIGGGMLWRCGNAEMVADSAVRYEAAARVELIGHVEYRDTIRTLDSDFLSYYELPDLVVATGNVHLTRLSSGSTLDGPRIEFLRAVSGGGEEVTTASGRPHLTFYPSREGGRPPFEVDADLAVLAGEETAAARGDVLIRRPDLLARADSAFFDIEAGGGVLYGSPEVEGEGLRLSGDTLRLRFEEDELREVWARSRAYAAGESFEVMAEEIRALVEAEKAREVWAFGPARSLAIAPPYRVYGDSLRFVLSAGSIDSVVAVGSAVAIELPEADEVGAAGTGERLADPGAGEDVPAVAIGEQPADTAVLRRIGRARPASVPAPRLGVEESTSWMVGDTLFAVFQPVSGDSVDSGAGAVEAEARAPVPEEEAEAGVPEAEAEASVSLANEPPTADPGDGLAAADSSGVVTADSADRRLERIRVVGAETSARAYYAAVIDSSRTSRSSRNYIVGKAIEILFQNGEVYRVTGDRAIGIYLDPREERDTGPPPETESGNASGDGARAGRRESLRAAGGWPRGSRRGSARPVFRLGGRLFR